MECSAALDPWEGQAGARTYWFSARTVAHALVRIADGATYRAAAFSARRLEARLAPGKRRGKRTRRNLRRSADFDGQLAANWVDIHAPVITDALLPGEWPERLALDSAEFRILGGGLRAGKRFHILAAVGYGKGNWEGRVWRLFPAQTRQGPEWEGFLRMLTSGPGQPERVITDDDAAAHRRRQESVSGAPGVFVRSCPESRVSGRRAPVLRVPPQGSHPPGAPRPGAERCAEPRHAALDLALVKPAA